MTQEEKQLLLKDLCARLPYGFTVHRYSDNRDIAFGKNELDVFSHFLEYSEGEKFKPYLRSMESMTEEELKELNDKYGSIAYFFIQEPPYYHGLQAQHSDIGSIEISEFSEIYDWLNAHHFDFRGLIEKGLALEAPEKMYKND